MSARGRSARSCAGIDASRFGVRRSNIGISTRSGKISTGIRAMSGKIRGIII
jgi:hypothetical protein